MPSRLPRRARLSPRPLLGTLLVAPLAALALVAGLAPVAALAAPASSGPSGSGQEVLAIVVPSHARASIHAQHPFSITIDGYAPVREQLLAFVDYDRCLATPALERRRQARGVAYAVSGSFSRRSSWESRLARTDHVCAYLVDPTTGAVVARRSATFAIH